MQSWDGAPRCSSARDRLLILIVWSPVAQCICIPTSWLSCLPLLLPPQPVVQPPRMQAALRPLPRIPPPHLTLPRPADIRSYRPLPTPPLQSADSIYTSSSESLCLWTPPTRTASLSDTTPQTCTTRSSSSSLSSLSSPSSELLVKSRPRLRIVVTAPKLRKRCSLDVLTVRSPALRDPGQVLLPVVDRRNDKPTIDAGWSTRVPRTSTQPNRISVADSVISPIVFNTPAAATQTELNTPESEEDSKSALARTFSVPLMTHLTRTCSIPSHPGTYKKGLRACCGSATTPITTDPSACRSHRNCPSGYSNQPHD